MRRAELEHLIRAAAAVTNEYEIVVIGSQSILASVPAPPPELVQSMEADCYPLRRPELADLIDGAIGELSPFHERFGYYAQGVGPETAVLPDGWQERLVKLQNEQTDLKLGWCLEPHDLAAAKLVAGRDKDGPFVATMLRHGIISMDTLVARIAALPLDEARKARLQRQARRLAQA
ncbi:DUF6036 family nucleotidyltransferase [Ottowia pentelensis]|uniref:DUF6036 family nucleotidyltransferase n=1 Tax=Ottowia pentelensis TaxID=511108 RepID=A0ABV6PUA4_9BURK